MLRYYICEEQNKKQKSMQQFIYTHVLYYQSNMWIAMFNFVLNVYSPQRLKNAFGKMYY